PCRGGNPAAPSPVVAWRLDPPHGWVPDCEGGIAMTRVTVDQATLERLHGLKEPLELCDESGRILGTFHPESGPTPGGAAAGRETEPTPSPEQYLNVFGREDNLEQRAVNLQEDPTRRPGVHSADLLASHRRPEKSRSSDCRPGPAR